jgi:hypothetical protein
MPWFKVDDGFAFHRKAIRAGNLALGLWVRAGSWSAQQLTDGHIPSDVVVALGGTADEAKQLVASELWEEDADGYSFRNWVEFQPSKEAVEADRLKAKIRKQEWRDKKGGPTGRPTGTDGGTPSGTGMATPPETNDGVPPTPTRPDPTRPDPTPLPTEEVGSSTASRRGTRLPEDFAITDEMKAWAVEKGMTGAYVVPRHEMFMNHWPSVPGKGGVKLDWVMTWKNWMLRDFTPPAGNVTAIDFGDKPTEPKPPTDDMRQRWKS